METRLKEVKRVLVLGSKMALVKMTCDFRFSLVSVTLSPLQMFAP